MNKKNFEYDICLSFAGEQREYVEQVADKLKSFGVRVFYDDYARAELWGKDLYSHLDEIYQNLCRYCILFASKEYADKVWTNQERRSAQARALKEKKEYVLPARFDNTPIPGLRDTIHYIDLKRTSPSDLADLTRQKLGNPLRKEYLPPVLDRLFERLGIEGDDEAEASAQSQARSFFQALHRMTPDEKNAVLSLFRFGCHADLPQNIHIDIDLLRRMTGMSVPKLKRLLGGANSLGFECSIRESTEEEARVHGTVLGDSYLFELTWVDLSDEGEYPALLVASEMVAGATENYCEEHGTAYLNRLDFSQLSNATASVEGSGADSDRES